MSTQLRLVDPPEPRKAKASGAPPRRARAVAGGPAPRNRRAASWGEWHLDARTRRVGQAGVARARKALEAVVEQELSRAS